MTPSVSSFLPGVGSGSPPRVPLSGRGLRAGRPQETPRVHPGTSQLTAGLRRKGWRSEACWGWETSPTGPDTLLRPPQGPSPRGLRAITGLPEGRRWDDQMGSGGWARGRLVTGTGFLPPATWREVRYSSRFRSFGPGTLGGYLPGGSQNAESEGGADRDSCLPGHAPRGHLFWPAQGP